MRSLAAVLSILLAIVALMGFGLGVYEWVVPPYSDQEIRDAMVDTWEPYAWFTLFSICVLGIVVVFAAVVATLARRRDIRLTAAVAIALAVSGAFMAYRNHAALTERTTELTGQTFGRFNGLL